MIDHLIQRQDIEDRKKIMMLAASGDSPTKSLSPSRHSALQQSTSKSYGDRISHPGAPEVTFSRRPPGRSGLSPSKMEEQKRASPTRFDNYSPHKRQVCPGTVLKVDRNCLNCSGNMTHTVKGIKTACLMYAQSKIRY